MLLTLTLILTLTLQLDARGLAEEEQLRLDTWQEEQARSLREQAVKARLRHKQALEKEMLKHVSLYSECHLQNYLSYSCIKDLRSILSFISKLSLQNDSSFAQLSRMFYSVCLLAGLWSNAPWPQWPSAGSYTSEAASGGHYTSKFSTQHRADSGLAPSQWETALLCNDISHWLRTSLESALQHISHTLFPLYLQLINWTSSFVMQIIRKQLPQFLGGWSEKTCIFYICTNVLWYNCYKRNKLGVVLTSDDMP